MRDLRMPALAAAAIIAGGFGVAYKQGVSATDARRAIETAGGQVVDENAAIGVATVKSDDGSFQAKAAEQPALEGAANNKPIGYAPPDAITRRDDVERGGPG